MQLVIAASIRVKRDTTWPQGGVFNLMGEKKKKKRKNDGMIAEVM